MEGTYSFYGTMNVTINQLFCFMSCLLYEKSLQKIKEIMIIDFLCTVS